MNVFFEDSQSLEFSLSTKHLFYCFYNSSMAGDLPINPHWHYYIEIIYVTLGKGQLILNGQTFTMGKGDLAYILPQDVHAIESLSYEDFKYAVIKFDPSILFDAPFDAFILKHILPVIAPVPANHKLISSHRVSELTVTNIEYMMITFNEKPFGYEFMVKSKLMVLFYDLIWMLKEKGHNLIDVPRKNTDLANIIPAFHYIHNHFSKPITAEIVADHCHLSYSYFSRLFKRTSGITFTKYLNFTRVTEAERLLLEQKLSITEIGLTVGFSDTSYFIHQFKSFKKTTPKQFLKLVLEDT